MNFGIAFKIKFNSAVKKGVLLREEFIQNTTFTCTGEYHPCQIVTQCNEAQIQECIICRLWQSIIFNPLNFATYSAGAHVYYAPAKSYTVPLVALQPSEEKTKLFQIMEFATF